MDIRPSLPKTAPPKSYDQWHIDLHEPWEIRFWTRECHCDEFQLRMAVEAVGTRVGAVRDWLAARH